MSEPAFRELSHSADDLTLLARLYEELYEPEFPDPDERESLENMQHYLQLKQQGWYGPNNYHIVVLSAEAVPVGLSISDYLAEPKAGMIEFLVIADAARGGGFGAKLLAHTEALLAQDAARNGEALSCIAAEMNDPFKSPLDDSLDPFVRARVWGDWGYSRLDFPYEQPALAADKGPVKNLLLMAKPVRRDLASYPSTLVKNILRNYMIWAMRIPEPRESPVYRAMSAYLDKNTNIGTQHLGAYVGHDPGRPLHVREVADQDDPDRRAVIAVYRQSFPGGRTDIKPEDFARAQRQPGYHLWAIRSTEFAPVEGMASFFGFAPAGFGGYIALAGSLRHTGRFALLLARMEERMRRDFPGAHGLFIECDPEKQGLFRHFGFRTVEIAYRQPPLPGANAYAVKDAPPLSLMYKAFGRNYGDPVLAVADFLDAMRAIFVSVYDIADPDGSAFFADLKAPTSMWAHNIVRFRS